MNLNEFLSKINKTEKDLEVKLLKSESESLEAVKQNGDALQYVRKDTFGSDFLIIEIDGKKYQAKPL